MAHKDIYIVMVSDGYDVDYIDSVYSCKEDAEKRKLRLESKAVSCRDMTNLDYTLLPEYLSEASDRMVYIKQEKLIDQTMFKRTNACG